MPLPRSLIAFKRHRRIAAGSAPEVARTLCADPDAVQGGQVLVFDAETGQAVDLDLRGTPDEAAERAAAAEATRTAAAEPKPGRPRLGVVAREVTLLPRHWDWLNAQPGGASVTLRRLVEAARHGDHASEDIRRRQDRAYRFMSAVGGDLPDFEEAARALYAWDTESMGRRMAAWPPDVREQVEAMVRRGA